LSQTQEALDAAYFDYAHDRTPEALGALADHVRFEAARLGELDSEAAAEAADGLEVALVAFDRMAQDLSNRALRLSLLGDIEVDPRFGSLYARLAWLCDAELERLHPILDWQMVGPFDNERGRGMVRSTPAEKQPMETSYEGKVRPVAWRNLPATPPKGGVVSLEALMDPADQALALVRTYVWADADESVTLRLGASEEIRVWLEGTPIFEALGEHSFGFDAYAVSLELHQGWNELVLKVGSHEGSPMFQARWTDPQTGAPLVRRTQASVPEGVEAKALESPGRRIKDPRSAGPQGALARYQRAEGPEAAFRTALIEAEAQATPRSERPGSEAAGNALAAEPENLRYRILAVETLRELGASAVEEDLNPYLAAIDTGIDQHGDLPWFLRRRADFALNLQRSPQMAWTWIERAVTAAPNSFLARRDQARIVAALGLSEKSKAMHRKLAMDPGSLVWAGSAYDYVFLLPPGSKEQERWLQAGIDAGSLALLRTSYEWRRTQAGEESVASYLEGYRALQDQAPWSSWTSMSTAKALQSAGHYQEALDVLADAEALCPERAEVQILKARLAWAMGDQEAAIRAQERVVELDFGNEAERRLLQYWKADTTEAFEESYREPLADILKRRQADEALGSDAGGLELLLRRVVTKVQPNGTSQAYHREVHRVLTEQGARQLDRRGFRAYPGEEEVRILQASVTRLDGTKLDAETGSSGNSGYVAVDFPPLQVGDVVDLEWRDDQLKTGVFGNYFGMKELMSPDDSLYVRESEVVLLVPASFPLYLHERNFDGESLKEDLPDGGQRLTWRVKGLTPPRQEGGMPPLIERAPQVHASSFASWEDFGRWWWSLIEEELRPSPEISAKVSELVKDATTPLERLRAIYNFVVTDIRYNAWEFGVHGYEPYSAAVIFSRGFGDCKDKAILLKVMLGEAGIEAWPVLIRSEGRRYEEDHTLALVEHFNHCIAYVPAQEGIEEMFLDGTARFHQLDELPASDAGAQVLVVRGDGVETRRIRFPEPQENHIRQEIRVDLTASGAPQVSLKREVRGRFDVGDRYRYSGSEEQKMEQAERFLSGLFGALEGTPKATWSDPEDLDHPLESTFEAGVESVSRTTSKGIELPTTFEAMNLLRGAANETTRTSDLLFDVPWSKETVIDYVLGEGSLPQDLPPDVAVESEDASYARHVETTSNGVRITETFALKTHRIPVERYEQFRKVCREVDGAQADSIEVEVKQ